MTRVLVVDDDLGIRRLARFILDSAGYEVALARHGQEALSMLNETDADVIVLDLNADASLRKPFRPDELVAKVYEVTGPPASQN